MNDQQHGMRLVDDRSNPDDSGVVERLLLMAGHRPEVPIRDAEMVKQAARAQWQQTVRTERRRTWLTRGAGGLLAAAALVLLVLNTDQLRFPAGAENPIATVEAAVGRVLAGTVETDWAIIASGDAMAPGTIVETAAAGSGTGPSRMAFRLADGASIRLDAGSRVRVESPRVLILERGALYADSGPNAPATDPALEIQTPLGIVRDIGTQFMVRLDNPVYPLQVPVREGKVLLDCDGDSYEATAGTQLTMQPDRRVEKTEISSVGAPWSWVLSVRPPFDADGKTLHEVLNWAQREAGWHLRYADPSLAADAAKNVVSGAIEDMSPEEAVGIFLAASGMTYRLEAGVLTVERGS